MWKWLTGEVNRLSGIPNGGFSYEDLEPIGTSPLGKVFLTIEAEWGYLRHSIAYGGASANFGGIRLHGGATAPGARDFNTLSSGELSFCEEGLRFIGDARSSSWGYEQFIVSNNFGLDGIMLAVEEDDTLVFRYHKKLSNEDACKVEDLFTCLQMRQLGDVIGYLDEE